MMPESNKLTEVLDEVTKKELTEAQLESVYAKLTETANSSEELKNIRQFPSNNGVLENPNNKNNATESEVVMMRTDVMTGQSIPMGPASSFNTDPSKLSIDDCIDNLPESIYDVNIEDGDILELSKEFNINELDTAKLLTVAKRYQNKEEFCLFDELPKSIQASITKELLEIGNCTKNTKKLFAESFITNILSEIGMDKYQVEFDKMIKDAFSEDIPELSDTLIDNIRTRKEQLYASSDKLVENGFIDKAEKLREIADACEEAYLQTEFKQAIKDHSIKIKKIELEQYNKVFRNFDMKYEKSVYNIRTVSCIPMILNRILPVDEFSTDDIMKFAVAFCKYTMNMQPSDPEEHSYMYYTIDTIIALEMKTTSKDNEAFVKKVIDNIKECITLLKEYYK